MDYRTNDPPLTRTGVLLGYMLYSILFPPRVHGVHPYNEMVHLANLVHGPDGTLVLKQKCGNGGLAYMPLNPADKSAEITCPKCKKL